MSEHESAQRFELHIDTGLEGNSAIDVLASSCVLSRQQLKHAMSNGCCWLQGEHGRARIRRANRILQRGQALHLYYDAVIQQRKPPAAEMIADEASYSVWNKPAGMNCQGSRWGDHCSLTRWAGKQLQRDAFLVHRLDRATRGLIILAHDKRAARAFSALFRERGVTKHYLARVSGHCELALPLQLTQALDDKPSESIVLGSRYDAASDTTELELRTLTGRKHQVRRHLQGIGHSIIGDRLYGEGPHQQDLQLVASRLEFDCPVSGERKRYSI